MWTGQRLNTRGFLRLRAAALPLALAMGASSAGAQYGCDPDEALADEFVIEEGAIAPADRPSPPPPRSPARAAGVSGGWNSAAELYTEPPDLARCHPGSLRPEAKASFVAALNAMRALHGLGPVRHDPAADGAVAESALMMAANDALSHDPPPSWKCWTAAGAAAAGSSNLLGGVSSPSLPYEDDNGILAEWLIEGDSDEIGHRRWLLYPYLEQTALGRVIAVLPSGVRVDSAVMKVFGPPDDSMRRARPAAAIPEFVAWPQGDYPRFFFSPRARLSFSISEDQTETDRLGAVDFSEAKISISLGGRSLPVRDQMSDNEGFGTPNNLSWRVDGIEPNRTYSVKISGVRGSRRVNYEYDFRIIG